MLLTLFLDYVGVTITDLNVCYSLELSYLQNILENSSESSSPYNLSNAQNPSFTDTQVYPSPSSDVGSDRKKRKRDEDGEDENSSLVNGSSHPRYPSLVHANKHLLPIHEQMKRECEDLIKLCVRVFLGCLGISELIKN